MTTATDVATTPGIMNEWLSTYLPIRVVPDRSKLMWPVPATKVNVHVVSGATMARTWDWRG